MTRVAIEEPLQNVKSYLEEKGYFVEDLDRKRNQLDSYDAIVVTGQDSNFLGIQDSSTTKSVISAKGRTPVEIYNEIEKRKM